ncbi:uncharacterized protein LOC122290987 [Carya illinoinensis]|uniref:uncharacterized protein LOC122290987 n=1 Tax=Carya illinoinensis TaxID=32201 RepID=UPI001C71A6F0|nr:uncharacterized protein LOC122290987 [Carya illinoinensis]
MVAKQGWKFLREPSSLVARIYKEKYFSSVQFSKASLGKAPSLIWRSIWSAREVVLRGTSILGADSKVRCKGESSNDSEKSELWKHIWELEVYGGCKHFLWKAVSNTLPTRANLYKRKIIEDPLCPICQREEENVLHALWSCPAASDVWGEMLSPVQKWRLEEKDFQQLWLRMVKRLTKNQIEITVNIMKRIWGRRNEVLFENKFMDPGKLVQNALIGWEVFLEANKKTCDTVREVSSISKQGWEKPVGNCCKVNFDAALDMVNKKIGLGIIVRNNAGDIMAAVCTPRKLVVSPFLVECHALWRSMEVCRELGFWDIILEGDAKNVIDRVNSATEDESEWGQIITDLKTVLGRCDGWSLNFIHREKNGVAHFLAKMALNLDEERCWIEEGPIQIEQLIVKEKSCITLNT